MNIFGIKLLGIIFMTLDHIGLFFFPQIWILGVVGRFAFPIFAWLIANGAIHTKNINKYLLRLFIFAAISQVPFLLSIQTINPSYFGFNVLFTLFLGLLSIKFIKEFSGFKAVIAVLLCLMTAFLLNVEYGVWGVLSVVAFYVFIKNLKYQVLSQLLIFTAFAVTTVVGDMWSDNLGAGFFGYIEPVGVFSLLFISLYDGKQGYKSKYLFYFFYLGQFVLIYFLLNLFPVNWF